MSLESDLNAYPSLFIHSINMYSMRPVYLNLKDLRVTEAALDFNNSQLVDKSWKDTDDCSATW